MLGRKGIERDFPLATFFLVRVNAQSPANASQLSPLALRADESASTSLRLTRGLLVANGLIPGFNFQEDSDTRFSEKRQGQDYEGERTRVSRQVEGMGRGRESGREEEEEGGVSTRKVYGERVGGLRQFANKVKGRDTKGRGRVISRWLRRGSRR